MVSARGHMLVGLWDPWLVIFWESIRGINRGFMHVLKREKRNLSIFMGLLRPFM